MAYAPARTRNVLSTTARTASVTSRPVNVPAGTGAVRVRINTTADPAAASVVFKIQGQAPDATWYDMLTSAAVNAVGERILNVGRGLTAAANVTVVDIVPEKIRIVATHADSDSITYGVTAEFAG